MFSDNNVLFVTVWPTVLCALSVVLVIMEYLLIRRRRAVFTLISALFLAASCVIFVWKQCSLCDLLVLICITLAVRLFFEIREGRKNK